MGRMTTTTQPVAAPKNGPIPNGQRSGNLRDQARKQPRANAGSAQTPGAPKYRIEAIEGRGQGMVAGKDLARGERILAEEQVFIFKLLKKDGDDLSKTLYSDDNKVNTTTRFRTAFKKLEQTKKDKFKALKNSVDSSNNDLYDTVALYAFEHDDEYVHINKGKPFLVVYDEISRVNHSCKPNAIVDWNSALEKGTLHALTPIAEGDEILISYCSTAKDTFKTAANRREELLQQYGFDCQCECCATTKEDGLRVKLAELYRHTKWDEMTTARIDATDEAVRQIEVGQLKLYREAMVLAKIKDDKVAKVYRILAYYAECKGTDRLEDAYSFTRMAHEIDIVCYGDDHPVVIEDHRRMDRFRDEIVLRQPGLRDADFDEIAKKFTVYRIT